MQNFSIFVIRNLETNMLRTKNITNLRTLLIIQVNLQFQQKKKIKELIKREKRPQKPYLTDYKLLTVQEFWQAHYQILLIILLKEFKKLNVKINMIIKNAKRTELHTSITTVLLNTQTLEMI